MVPDPQPGSSTSGGAADQKGLVPWLRRHARKGLIAVGVAVLGGAGLAITNWVRDKSEDTTHKVLVGLSGGPIDVTVMPEGEFTSGHVFAPYYVIPRDQVAGPPEAGKARVQRIADQGAVLGDAWTVDHGGIPGSPQIIRLELSGKSDKKVMITGLQPQVLSSDPPVSGWYVANPGCGVQPVRIATLNLDAPAPVRGFFDEGGRERPLLLTVTKDDHEQLELHASTRRAAVTWKAKIFYRSPEGSGSVTIPEGDPFKVTSETASEGFRPDFAGSRPSLAREPGWDQGITAC